MRTFVHELKIAHRARIGALLRRHRAGVGYAILCVGVVIALLLAAKARQEVAQRVERQAAVICRTTTVTDQTQLARLHTKAGHELFAALRITIPQARVLIHAQLVQTAQERRALQPSDPASACSAKLTTLPVR